MVSITSTISWNQDKKYLLRVCLFVCVLFDDKQFFLL